MSKKKTVDCSMDAQGIRIFTTCEEYRNYMAGEHDDIADRKANRVPDDAMSLAELRNNSRGKLLGIINHAGAIENRSDIRNMFANGYGFPWAELDVIARYEGFVKDSGNSRVVHYSAEGVTEIEPPKIEDGSFQDEVFRAQKAQEPISRVSIYMFPEDHAEFKETVRENTVYGTERMGQAVLCSKMLRRTLTHK